MLLYHFVTVPKIPKEVQHQSGTVEIVCYLVPEEKHVNADTAILTVRNWWAEMDILSGYSGRLVSAIFNSKWCEGGHIKEGDPVALLVLNAEGSEKGELASRLRIKRHLREKRS
jgi:hypothetical protein